MSYRGYPQASLNLPVGGGATFCGTPCTFAWIFKKNWFPHSLRGFVDASILGCSQPTPPTPLPLLPSGGSRKVSFCKMRPNKKGNKRIHKETMKTVKRTQTVELCFETRVNFGGLWLALKPIFPPLPYTSHSKPSRHEDSHSTTQKMPY